MAYQVRIEGIAADTGQVILAMKPNWWDAYELREDERFVDKYDKTGSYIDYEAKVSVVEMKHIHEKYKKETTTGLYALPEWQEVIQPKLRELDEALYSWPDAYSHFNITVFEWESGY